MFPIGHPVANGYFQNISNAFPLLNKKQLFTIMVNKYLKLERTQIRNM